MSALGREEFVAAAWEVVERKVDERRQLEEIHELAQRSIALPLAADSIAVETFRLQLSRYVIVCLGTTFSYNYSNAAIRACLQNFSRHLSPDGRLVIDVLNAIAFMGPRPFQRRTQHHLWYQGKRTTATIRHELDPRRQLMTEQVTWRSAGQTAHRDPPEKLRLFFPQELAFHLEQAGFGNLKLMDTFGKSRAAFVGRRLIAVAGRRSL